jgi:alcohol oxidase
MAPDSKTATLYVSKSTPHVAGRNCAVTVGNILGGGSSINFMVYTRPAASDYDDWNTEGWTFQDLIPLFKKVT